MFSANRVIAIDDESDYLVPLCRALHSMGIPCIPVHYPGEMPGEDAHWLKKIRIVFCDLHLLPAAARLEQNYAAIGSMLERMTSPEGSFFSYFGRHILKIVMSYGSI